MHKTGQENRLCGIHEMNLPAENAAKTAESENAAAFSVMPVKRTSEYETHIPLWAKTLLCCIQIDTEGSFSQEGAPCKSA